MATVMREREDTIPEVGRDQCGWYRGIYNFVPESIYVLSGIFYAPNTVSGEPKAKTEPM